MPTGAVHTLYLPGIELPAAGQSSDWLVAAEQAELALLGDEGRRREWLAGRWVAKRLLLESGLAQRASDVEICSRDARRRGNRPRVRICGRPFGGSLSIAHTSRGAMAAVTMSHCLAVGIDLVDLSDMARASGNRGFARLCFTPLERCWIAGDRQRRTAVLWAIKEAVYKACQMGEAWSPRDIVVWPRVGGSYHCFYRGRAIEGLRLEVEQIGRHLAVVASFLRTGQLPAEVMGDRPWRTRGTGQINVLNTSSKHELILGQAS